MIVVDTNVLAYLLLPGAKTDLAEAFLKDNPVRFEVAFDPSGKTPRAYAVKSMPTSVLIGPDGKVLMIHSGFRPEESQAREGQIKMSLK